ncbi:pyridoxal phosphate-dependent aminotransferase [Sporosarcina limicola]|uniref:Aminotransferase n=1 Tax=Sporosarcina limicola TaxID=34101 RepID=A0A927MQY2_9BACL|nr:threonine-phosphate decarboxylase [Sporosarcina limicola]MBE1555746.1 threonine-phosphate decarboxylase [Sporosarcina limicola]
MRLPEHGANPFNLYTKLGIKPPEHVLDFSENVNPAGPPQSVIKIWPELLSTISEYPNPAGEPFLSAIAEFHGISQACLFAGNGAVELLALIAERYRGKQAVVVHPTFSEYEATLLARDVVISRIIASETVGFELPLVEIMQAMETADVLYLCTPNNPTGIMPKRETLQEIIRHGAEVHCDVVLDEAFIDFVDESLSFIVELTANPHVIIVRSMTKMYAIPGIRLGYVVANPAVINQIKALAPHWNVNGIAARIGAICLQEESYRQQAIQHSNQQREKLKGFLQENGCTVTDSVTNFLSFKLPEGQTTRELYRVLLGKGIVVRHSENFRGMDGRWLRIGLKKEVEMANLTEELRRWFAEN